MYVIATVARDSLEATGVQLHAKTLNYRATTDLVQGGRNQGGTGCWTWVLDMQRA